MSFSRIIPEASYKKVQHFLYERLSPERDVHNVQGKSAFMILRASDAVVVLGVLGSAWPGSSARPESTRSTSPSTHGLAAR